MAQVKQSPKCSICRKIPQPDCDYKQGRCPHRPSIFEQIISNPYKSRFFNLLNFFKGRNESPRSSKTQKHKSSKKRT
jgi:hypothetical protein